MSGDPSVKNLSSAYRFWGDLIEANIRLAVAPKGDGPGAHEAARERFREGWRRALRDRDEALERMIACLERADRGR